MIYDCVFPDNLTKEEKAAVGDANVVFDMRTPIIGDVLLLENIKFKVSGIIFNLEKRPTNSSNSALGATSFYHNETTLLLTKFPG